MYSLNEHYKNQRTCKDYCLLPPLKGEHLEWRACVDKSARTYLPEGQAPRILKISVHRKSSVRNVTHPNAIPDLVLGGLILEFPWDPGKGLRLTSLRQ